MSQVSSKFIEEFNEWLSLKWEGVTWFGRFQIEFQQFWSLVFSSPLNVQTVYFRLSSLEKLVDQGPVQSWLRWLSERFLVFSFIKLDQSINSLAQISGLGTNDLGRILKDYFSDSYPSLEEEFAEVFLTGTIISPYLNLKYSEIEKKINLSKVTKQSDDEDVMTTLEVTLYGDWALVLAHLKSLVQKGIDEKTKTEAKPHSSWDQLQFFKFPWRFIRDLALLLVLGTAVLNGVKYLNQYFEINLLDKISIFEPDFLWLNKKLSFKDVSNQATDIQVSFKEFEDLEKNAPSLWEETTIEESREGTESEATITVWSDLPRDLEKTDLSLSPFEEEDKENLRDSAYGNRKIFRVMLKSILPEDNLLKIDSLIAQFGAKQVDKVKPGQPVPGGYYYNLYVPLEGMRDFLGQVSYVDESIIFESRTRGVNPQGMGRVFIWVKKI